MSHTCANGASCVDGINTYSCNCAVGFRGTYCDIGKWSRVKMASCYFKVKLLILIRELEFLLSVFNLHSDMMFLPIFYNNGETFADWIKKYSFTCTVGFYRFCYWTGEKKINEMKYCDHTVDIHALSFHETLIATINHHYFRRQKYHGQRKDGVKSHINSLGKDRIYYQLINVNKRSFSFRYRRLPQSHLH